MERFTAKGALLTGVDLIRRRPWLVVLSLALTIVFAVTYKEFMAWLRADIFSGRSVTALSGLTAAYALVQAVLSMLLTSVLWASAFRALLRPGARPALGFGAEELCVFAAWFFIQTVMALVSLPVQVLLLRNVLAMDGRWLVHAGTAIGVLGLFWSAVAAAWAFDRVQVVPFRCWTIARGRFWLLAGLVLGVAVLLHLADAAILHLVNVMALRRAPGLVDILPTMGELTAAFRPRTADLGSLFQAPALVRDVLGAAIRTLEIVFVSGIVASAYRSSAPQPQAASFSSGGATAEPS